jgi:hypothetical protein
VEHGDRGRAVGARLGREIPPEELYEKLEPFKRLVAEDIRQGGRRDDER